MESKVLLIVAIGSLCFGSDVLPVFGRIQKLQYNPDAYGDATKIIFSNGITFDTKSLGKTGEPDLPADLKIQYRDDEIGYYIVQFSEPIYGKEKNYLESIGAKIHFYVPNYGFVISLNSKTQKDLILSNPEIVWFGSYQPAYKISSLFNQTGDEHKVTMLLFPDADIQEVLDKIIEITAQRNFIISDNGINKIIQGVVNKNYLHTLAKIKEIYWIEPYVEPRFCNIDIQWILQDCELNVRNIWNKGIAGEGEIVNLVDSGIYTTHYAHCSGSAPVTDFGYYPEHNAIVAYDSAGPNCVFGGSLHGTIVAGTLTGDDTLTPGNSLYDGIAKRSRLYHSQFGGSSGAIFLFPDLNDLYIRPYSLYYPPTRAFISSNQWGASTNGHYDAYCQQVDQFMWSHKDFLTLFAAGNAGPGPGTVNSPASAKNCIAVGATGNRESGYTQYPSYNSRGPTTDGRLKPTLLSPGGPVTSSGSPPNGYTSMNGTSAATSGASGTGALIRQYLREGWYPTGKKDSANGWDYISAAMIKAILINCADTNISQGTFGYIPNNNLGWGRIDLDSTLYFEGDLRKTLLYDDTIGLLTAEIKDFYCNIPQGSRNLKVTLVWTDYPGNPVVLKQLVNDLDLYVMGPSGTYYYGNQYSMGQSIPNPSMRDTLNVEECVRVNEPDSGEWLVRIEARNVPYGPQPFALVITYPGAGTAGFVSLDKPVYRANDFSVDTVRVRVEDLNYGSVGIQDTLFVFLKGKYIETQPETLRCVELADSSYVFKGEMPLLFRGAIHNDGKLSVCQGDTIYATYTDNNPAFISQVWAGVDAWYFLIQNVHCENIDVSFADICWNTNESSNSKVYYGTNPSNLNLVAQVDTPYCMPHRVRLSGLSPNTIYYYDVESKDFRGNTVRDNNGGLHYTFKTRAVAGVDILVLLCDGTTDAIPQGQALPGLRERFRKAIELGGWNYNYWETSDNLGYTPSREVMKDYKAVFLIYEDEYPPFIPVQQETIRKYEELGGRIAFSSHDVLWHAWENSTNKEYDTTWCKNYMQVRFKYDGASTGTYNIYGVSGDPISGPYASAPVSYTPHRSGAAYDSLDVVPTPPNGWDPGGTSNPIWRWNSATGGRIGARWESGNNHGTIGDGVWGGYRTRTIFNGFSVIQMDTTKLPDILNNHFIWLIGHDHPDVMIHSPIADTTYTTSPIIITWDATAYGGAVIDTTWVEYSPDAGQTWYLIAADTGMIMYQWDLSNIQNGNRYRIRITVNDRGVYPSLRGYKETGNFIINVAGNDDLGPKVIPNSIILANNPKFVTPTDTLLPFNAVISDSLSGMSIIISAQYIAKSGFQTTGELPMEVSDGLWDEIEEDVNASIRLVYVPEVVNVCSLFVRGCDSLNNWGGWYYRTFTLVDGDIRGTGIIEDIDKNIPPVFTLYNPVPNPAKGKIKIIYAIPNQTKVNLQIYNCLGQIVRNLTGGEKKSGLHQLIWNGCDDRGRVLPSGVYFVQLATENSKAVKKIILLE